MRRVWQWRTKRDGWTEGREQAGGGRKEAFLGSHRWLQMSVGSRADNRTQLFSSFELQLFVACFDLFIYFVRLHEITQTQHKSSLFVCLQNIPSTTGNNLMKHLVDKS